MTEREETIAVYRAQAAADDVDPLVAQALNNFADFLERKPDAAPLHAPVRRQRPGPPKSAGPGIERSLPVGDREDEQAVLFGAELRF